MGHGRYKKVAVVSRYKENKKFWYQTVRDRFGYKMMLYNKFSGRNLLPNVGREGHTYMTYIIDHYDDLPEEVLFTQYNPKDHFSTQSIFGINNLTTNWDRFLNAKLYDFIGIRPTDFDYEVRHRNIDWIEYCKILFPTFNEQDINRLIFYGSNINGVFRASRNAILRRPKSFYMHCLDLLSTDIDPDSGYFFERMWKFIFARYGCMDTKYNHLVNQLFLFGGNQFTTHNYSAGVVSKKSWKQNNYGHIYLHESGCLLYNTDRLSLYAHPNETYWLIENDKLMIFDAEGGLRHTFPLTISLDKNNKELIYGDYWDIDGTEYPNAHWIKPKMFQDRFNLSNFDKADPTT